MMASPKWLLMASSLKKAVRTASNATFVTLILACTIAFTVFTGWFFRPATAAGNNYVEMRSAAVRRCEAIDPSKYQSGLMFNPDGYRSFYVRSACFQDAAIEFREESLCAQVKRRLSLFSSSWGYSSKRCRQLVDEGIAADRKSLEETRDIYMKGAVKLRDFRVERNGNGRDFDILPFFDRGQPHGYTLRFEIIDTEATTGNVLVDSSGFYLDGNDNIRIFVRPADIRKRFPHFELGRVYRVQGTLTLSVGTGGQGGRWSNDFIERVFPAAERSQSLVKEAIFESWRIPRRIDRHIQTDAAP